MKIKILVVLLLAGFSVFAQDVKRVISLAPSITENIYLVGGKDKLVGCTSYCMLALNDGIEEIGSTVDVNVERIFALKPDMVLTMKLTKAQDIATLEKLGLRVEVLETPRTFDEICAQTQQIAELIGCEDQSTEVVAKARKTVAEIQAKSKQLPPSKIFFQIGANPVFSVLDNTYMNDFMLLCNATNIASGLKHGTLTRESVLLKNPDVIIIAEMGGFGKEERKVWNTYEGMEAVNNNKVFLISSETACSPTPANFASALKDVYRFISE
ncbi:iron complex transport system substrate-binding protein [Draconibacterium orientale]|uniref:Iron complex transport system substrate-binding protein n=2 Tax=Draconibacterium orientale TaxID=1168034 RepID=A0A1I0IHV9_9BACT|nr:helical backbone metal receptor [Draconibacterium orientale]SET96596.1 iron complex transport system substrate-binding protein [Draconibacterium orientale]